jgi:hypothetical protein
MCATAYACECVSLCLSVCLSLSLSLSRSLTVVLLSVCLCLSVSTPIGQIFELVTGDFLFDPHTGKRYSRDEGTRTHRYIHTGDDAPLDLHRHMHMFLCGGREC